MIVDGPRRRRGAAALLASPLLATLACAPRSSTPAPPIPTAEELARSADALEARGSYACLLEAHRIRTDLHEKDPGSAVRRDARIRTALLLALREKQLAILDDSHLAEAQALLEACAGCTELQVMAQLADHARSRSAGIVRDFPPPSSFAPRDPSFPVRQEAVLRERALTSAATACFYLERWPVRRPGPPDADELDVDALVAAHPRSPLLLFEASLSGRPDLAQTALDLESTMWEARFVIGNRAAGRDPWVAVTQLRQAATGLPRSVSVAFSLAEVLVSIEELEEARSAYQRVIALAPEHRDAHLRLGIVLSMLGRAGSAIAPLQMLLDLGNWHLGEGHYWLAVARRDTGDPGEADRHVKEARHYLPDDPRVYALAGDLALDRDAEEVARDEFVQAVDRARRSSKDWDGDDALCHSLYSLGTLDSRREAWSGSTLRFEAAARCFETARIQAAAALEVARTWTLPEAQREALVARRTARVERASRQRAGSLYNAAVCAYRAGEADRALPLAREAATHELYAERARELITRMQ